MLEIIGERIRNNQLTYAQKSEIETNVLEFIEANKEFIKLNVFGVIREINRKSQKEEMSSRNLEDMYKVYLSPLIKLIKQYFQSKNMKYCKLIVVADNLDKTWKAESNLDIQSELIVSLIEIKEILIRELSEHGKMNIDVKEVIFLRKDIFDYIKNIVSEPDKYVTMSHEINWERYHSLLKEVIDNRFQTILRIDKEDVEKVWANYFDFNEKKHPFEVISELVVPRPRDEIYFISMLFGSAVDLGHLKVNKDDLDYAINAYSNFLNENLIAEIKAEFPDISEIFARLQKYSGEKMEYKIFMGILDDFHYSVENKKKLVKTLFDNEYMIGYDIKTDKPFDDLETLENKLHERKWLFPNKVYIIAHAKYYYIKHKRFKSF